MIDNTPPVHVLRSPCPRCTSDRGVIKPSGGQQCVYCIDCAKFLYNAPKSETGLPQRSVSTRPLLKPSQRARIIDRDNGHCVACGQTEGFMQVGHLLSVEDGRKIGATDAELWHDENLAVMCEECNLGFGRRTVSLRLVYRILKTRTTPA